MPLKATSGRASVPVGSKQLKGRVSWFGGPNDPSDSGHTALGITTATPGIAVYDKSTLGGYWLVTFPNGRSVVYQQTDLGPAPWTKRVVDVTYSGLSAAGYTENTFPTDSEVTALYLGKDKQAAETKAGKNTVSRVEGEVSGEGKTEDASFGDELVPGFSIVQDILKGEYEDLGAKLTLVGLQMVKDAAVGFVDLVIAPAWHWNQRSVAWYSKHVLDPQRFGDSTQLQYAFPWTVAFWSLGYVILYTDPDSGSLKPAPVHRSRFAHHVRQLQAFPARKALIKPKHVKEKTPKKPPPVASSAVINKVDTMSTTRPRQVRVERNGQGLIPTGERKSTTDGARVKISNSGQIRLIPKGSDTKPNQGDNSRSRAPKGSRATTKGNTKARRKHGRQN